MSDAIELLIVVLAGMGLLVVTFAVIAAVTILLIYLGGFGMHLYRAARDGRLG